MDLTERKKMIQKGFDTVAAGYDHPSLSFFPETAKRLLDYLDLQPDQHLLDVCTGTGRVSIPAAEALSQGHVTGIDLSVGMLQQARNKAEAQGLGNTDFIQMDLEALSLQALGRQQPYDIATSSFGLFFVEDMTSALGNIVSTVKPGGRVAITSFAHEAFSPFSDIFIEHFEATGREVPPLSWKRLATEDLIRDLFHAVGITEVQINHEPLGYHMTDEQNWWDIVWNAGWRSLLNQMSEQEQQEFEQHHRSEISKQLGEDGIWFNTEVLIAIGKKDASN